MVEVFELMNPFEIAEDIGRNIKLARAAKGWRQEDVSRLSGASLQAIKNLESGRNVEFATFIKVAHALGLSRVVWESCQPKAQTLDELERMEKARDAKSRVSQKA